MRHRRYDNALTFLSLLIGLVLLYERAVCNEVHTQRALRSRSVLLLSKRYFASRRSTKKWAFKRAFSPRLREPFAHCLLAAARAADCRSPRLRRARCRCNTARRWAFARQVSSTA